MVKKKKRRITQVAKMLADPTAIDFGMKKALTEVGSSGTDIVGGLYREESLQALQGHKGAAIFEAMRRREPTVTLILDSIKNPIKAANWSIECDNEQDEMQARMKRLITWNLFEGLEDGWDSFLHEALTFIDFGYSIFEAIHKTDTVDMGPLVMPAESEDAMPMDPEEMPGEEDMPAKAEPMDMEGEENDMTSSEGELVTFYQKFGFRKQTSIYRWKLERKTGKIISIEQQVSSDTSKETLVEIPGQFCLVFTNKKEGDNYEGVSALRPMYGPYIRKDLYLRLAAIGAEKNAVGTAIGKMPPSKVSQVEKEKFEAVLEAYAGNESAYVLIPEGYNVEIQYGQFDPQKMVTLLNFEDEQMCKAVIANFLNLGTGGNSGSLALGGTLSNFFLNGIQAYANIIANKINRDVIPALCQMNYGPQRCYPKLKCTGINDKAGKELADIILTLKNAQSITPDSKLEDFLRLQYKLPKQDPASARQAPVPVNPFDPNAPEEDNGDKGTKDGTPQDPKPSADRTKDKASLAEKKSLALADYKKQFDKNKEKLKSAMQANLRAMSKDLIEQLQKNYKDLGDANKVKAINGVQVRAGLMSAYKAELREILSDVAEAAIEQARKEVPKAARNAKFASTYEKLNPLVRKAIESQLGLVSETQAADLSKIVLFQWSSSASSSDDVDAIEQDVQERIAPVLDGSTNSGMSIDAAAGDLTAHVTQNSRNEFFFAPEVLDTIESFTFYNEDPISEICQNLNGQTFSANDPDAEQFYPPLHHNCKSRLIPNEKGSGEDITGIGIVADTVEERQRLEKQITLCGCDGHKLFS